MKTIKLIILITSVSLGKIFAQKEINALIFNTPKGVFIQAGGSLNPEDEIIIERKEDTFERIVSLKRPASKNELLANIQNSKEIFGKHAATPEGIEDVWNKFENKDRNTLTFILSMPQLSYIFGFSFLDKKVTENRNYQYRISVGNSRKLIELKYSKNWSLGEMAFKKSEANEKKILLWLSTNTAFQYLLRFDLSRKIISSTDYRKISPVVAWNSSDKAFVLMDTSLNFNGIYNYKVLVSDIFGNNYPEDIHIKADNLPVNLSFNITRFEATNTPEVREVKFNWEIANPDLIQSVTLLKSSEMEKNYKRIATFSPKENTWTDGIEIANELNFYRFQILDIFGRLHQSISFKHIYDLNIAASPVADFTIETVNNLPLLKFSAGDSHTRGFYVYRKAGEDDRFLQVSDFIFAKNGSGSFLDSSSGRESTTLYYMVKAENDTYQKSESSEILTFRDHLVLAKKSELEPPYDITLRYENKQPFLFWENMNAKNASIIGYNVYRKGENDKDFSLINKELLLFSQNYFQDTLVPTQTKYFYYLESVDVKGNKSPKSQPIIVDLSFEGNILPQETGFEITPNSIKINWTQISSPIAGKVKIYRSENNGKPSLSGTSDPVKQQFIDQKVTKGRVYSYQIAIVDMAGKEVLHSDIITVNF